jgi:hypothetical protein
VARRLLAANGIGERDAQFVDVAGNDAVEALLAGRVDAAFLVASARSPAVERLLASAEIRLLSFVRAAAYARRERYLSEVRLPRGVVDLAQDIPREDVVLLAATANLVASERLHPALVGLLLQAADDVHGSGGMFEDVGEFPSAAHTELPLSDEAKRFYKSGPPFLQRFLPFWAASLVDRMLVMLLPLVALMIPLARIMPPLYRWRIRARIYRWYRELVEIDPALDPEPSPERAAAALAELRRIEEEVARVHVPLSYTDQLYHLRGHIELVRGKLTAAARPEAPV